MGTPVLVRVGIREWARGCQLSGAARAPAQQGSRVRDLRGYAWGLAMIRAALPRAPLDSTGAARQGWGRRGFAEGTRVSERTLRSRTFFGTPRGRALSLSAHPRASEGEAACAPQRCWKATGRCRSWGAPASQRQAASAAVCTYVHMCYTQSIVHGH